MHSKYKLLISLILIVVVSLSYLNFAELNVIVTIQNDVEDNGLVSLDNATLATNHFSTHLEISFTRYGGSTRAENLGLVVILVLSLDKVSWIEVDNYTFSDTNRESNVSSSFRISNSISQCFPFDIEQGTTLYISIEYSSENAWDSYSGRLFPLAIEIPLDIIRPWYFTIDWTLPRVFSSIFLSLFIVFLVSRYGRKQIEKECRAKIKNEEL